MIKNKNLLVLVLLVLIVAAAAAAALILRNTDARPADPGREVRFREFRDVVNYGCRLERRLTASNVH